MAKKYTFIDLFAGCGGLSEGFLQTGRFEALAHVEWERPMVETLRNRLVSKWDESEDAACKKVILFDIQKTEELINGKWSDESVPRYGKFNHDLVKSSGLRGIVGKKNVDLIIGGPPCQAYSIHGRATDKNSMRDDYRNYLFESFVRVVDAFKPQMFVFENVPGILTAKPGGRNVTERIYEAFEHIGYEIRKPSELKNSVFDAVDFNVPQNRKRVIILGVKKDSSLSLNDLYNGIASVANKEKHLTVRDAIGSFPKIMPKKNPILQGKDKASHDLQKGSIKLSQHESRFHSARDMKAFTEWISKNLNHVSHQEQIDFYYKITGHKTLYTKYKNLEWDKPSHTVVAHLSKDGLMFLHPDVKQCRSITIREAATLMSFPLDYEFVASTPYCYRMIGNAVPVNFAKGIATGLLKVLEK